MKFDKLPTSNQHIYPHNALPMEIYNILKTILINLQFSLTILKNKLGSQVCVLGWAVINHIGLLELAQNSIGWEGKFIQAGYGNYKFNLHC